VTPMNDAHVTVLLALYRGAAFLPAQLDSIAAQDVDWRLVVSDDDPDAAASKGAGIVRGFAAAVAMLVLFYLIGQFTLVLGKNGWLPPFLAGAGTNLAFTAAGIVAMWKKQ